MVNPPFEISKNLDNNDNIVHGFFGKLGGVSTGFFESLNCSLLKGDDDHNVQQNRQLIAQSIGIDNMVTLRQVHKNNVLIVDTHTTSGYEADAMVTNYPQQLLAIQTADCAPILLVDHKKMVVGAIHAGWRSAVDGIVANTIKAMQDLGAQTENIKAAIGPCIQQQSFEVGADVFTAAKAAQFFKPSTKDGHYMFNLPGYLLQQLKMAGIEASALPLNTYTLEKQYFSYRRSCHQKQPSCGGQLSVIGIV